ncbi:hypothetical protein ST1_0056 [Streptococcus phage phiST1]|nr:hypothetical protein ST1_0056 [Streptococcus phage phiST1]
MRIGVECDSGVFVSNQLGYGQYLDAVCQQVADIGVAERVDMDRPANQFFQSLV